MVVRYPALPTQLASTSSASHSAHRSPAPLLRAITGLLTGRWREHAGMTARRPA